MQQAVRQFTRCGSARSREWSQGQGSLTFTWFAVAQGGLEVPAPTPQLLEAFSVEPQGSAGFFFRFKYSIQPAFSSDCSSLSSVVSGVFCHLVWATARPLPGRCHRYPFLSDPNSPQSKARLLSGHSGLVDVTRDKDIACTQKNTPCHLWYLYLVLFLFPAHYGDRFAYSLKDPYNHDHPIGPL